MAYVELPAQSQAHRTRRENDCPAEVRKFLKCSAAHLEILADQVAFVAAGKIEELAPPAELFAAPKSPLCKKFLSRVMRY